MNITDGDTTYLIKLDDLDINYILNYNFQNDGASWINSAQNNGIDEYVEFQIMAEKKPNSNFESVEDDSDNTITYPVYRCEICNCDVPLEYRKEHNSSVKHETCVKLAEAVQQRLQRHKLVEDNNEIVENSSNNYFCQPCAVIVRNTDKLHHTVSNAHLKSVLHDRFLSYLLNIYLDKDYLDTFDNDIKDLISSQSNNGTEDCDKTHNKGNDNKASVPNKIKIYGLSFDEERKPIAASIVPSSLSFSYDYSHENQMPKKQKKKIYKSRKIDLDDDLVDEIHLSRQQSRAPFQFSERYTYSEDIDDDLTNKTNEKQHLNANAIAKPTCSVLDYIQLVKSNKLNVDVKTEYVLDYKQQSIDDHNNSTEENNHSEDDLTNKRNEKQHPNVNAIAKPTSSVLEYIQLVKSNKLNVDVKTENVLDYKQQSIDDHNNSTEENNHSEDDLTNKRNEKQHPNVNAIAKPTSSVLEYIQLVKSNKLNVDVKTENVLDYKQQSIDDHNNSTEENNHSEDDLTNKRNEKQHPNVNAIAKPTSSVLEYIQLVKSNKLNVDVKTENVLDNKQESIDDSNNSTEENNHLEYNLTNKTNEKQNPNANVLDYIQLVNSNKLNIDEKTENILSDSNLKKYLDSLTNGYEMRPSHKLKLLNEDYIEVQTLDQCIVTVKVNNFNGFFSRDGHLQCRVCTVMVNEDPADHIYNINHLSNVRVPLEDMHCFRKINDLYKHCIHCNETFYNPELHKVSQTHLSALKDAIIIGMAHSASPKHVEPRKLTRTYCEPCNKHYDTHNMNSHINGKSHKYSLSLFYQPREKKTAEDVKSDGRKIHCEPCNLKVPKIKFYTHLHGKHHKLSLTSVIESKDNKENYCDTCNFYTENYSTHLTGAYHEYHVKKIVQKNTVEDPIQNNSTPETNYNQHIETTEIMAFCGVCNVKLPNKTENKSKHVKGRTHITNFKALLNKNRIKKQNKKFFCEACEIAVESCKELDHIKTDTHKNALEEFENLLQNNPPSTPYHCEPCDVDITNTPASITEHESTFDHQVSDAFFNLQLRSLIDYSAHYQYQRVANSIDELMCRICLISIAVPQAKLHLQSPAHNFKYRNTLNENRVQKVSNHFFCEICLVDIKDREELRHIRSTKHINDKLTANINSSPSPETKRREYHCKVCQVNVINETKNITMHEQGSSHRKKLKKLSFDDEEKVLMTKTAKGRLMMCALCKVAVSVSGVSEHVRGVRHKANKELAVTTTN